MVLELPLFTHPSLLDLQPLFQLQLHLPQLKRRRLLPLQSLLQPRLLLERKPLRRLLRSSEVKSGFMKISRAKILSLTIQIISTRAQASNFSTAINARSRLWVNARTSLCNPAKTRRLRLIRSFRKLSYSSAKLSTSMPRISYPWPRLKVATRCTST